MAKSIIQNSSKSCRVVRKDSGQRMFGFLLPKEIECQILSFINNKHYSIMMMRMTCKDNYYFFEIGSIYITDIIRDGSLSILQDFCNCILQNGCKWSEYSCSRAAKAGHLDVLKWIRENGFPWNEDTCSNAAKNGHLDVLKWSRENGCPWNEDTCSNAAKNGHLGVLKWARENGCPWNEDTCSNAAKMVFRCS